MEIKKSEHVDLERQRTSRFLLGLLMALTLLFVALEYPYEPDDGLDDMELLASMMSEPELPPLMLEQDLQVLTPTTEPAPSSVITIVDEAADTEMADDAEPVETDVPDDFFAFDDDMPLEPPAPDDDEAVSFRVVEDVPQFPGGVAELMKWLTRNLKYPKQLEEQGVQGRVVAEFIVNKDGSVTDVQILTSLHRLCDDEVLRVLRMMPRWTAGVMDGQPCRTKVCIPVVFRK